MKDILKEFDSVMEVLNCGDSACMFKNKTRSGGMKTNGGCRCLMDLSKEQKRRIRRLLQMIKKKK